MIKDAILLIMTLLFLLACAFFFYGAGEFGRGKSSGLAWAALSVLISAAICGWLHGGFIAVAVGQVGLFAGITLYRLWKDPPWKDPPWKDPP